MIDPTKETLIPIAKLDFHRAISLQSRMRYVLEGMRSLNGERIKLEALRIGHKWFSSQEAVERLIIAVNTPADEERTFTPAQRARQNEDAKRALELAGI